VERHPFRRCQRPEASPMTREEDALLRAVLSDPDAAGPRLAYADWFERNGQAGSASRLLQVTSSPLASPQPRGMNSRGTQMDADELYTRRATGCGDFRGVILRGQDLHEANLAKVDLREAELSGARLSGADLSGANLSRAVCRRCDFFGANLRGAL